MIADEDILEDRKEGFSELLEKLHKEKGWDFRTYRKSSLQRRIFLRLSALNISSYSDYCSLLESDPSEYERLFSVIVIKYSEFFRNHEVFDLIEDLLPSFPAIKGIRVWSCGCAFGEEAYSIGILFASMFGLERLGDVKIFATDIDANAIGAARNGIYQKDSLKNLDNGLKERYFRTTPRGYEIREEIRHMIRFGMLDITKSYPIPNIDMLLCRNLLIYLEKGLQETVMGKLDFALKTGGILVLGRSEFIPASLACRYRDVRRGSRVYRKI